VFNDHVESFLLLSRVQGAPHGLEIAQHLARALQIELAGALIGELGVHLRQLLCQRLTLRQQALILLPELLRCQFAVGSQVNQRLTPAFDSLKFPL